MMADDIVAALALPGIGNRPTRIPKTVLNERGAATVADRKLIDAVVDRLDWLATLNPASIGVAASDDPERPVAAIQLLSLQVRAEPTQRLLTMIHRAIPLPVILLTSFGEATRISLAPLRRAERIADAMVVERLVPSPPLASPLDSAGRAFLASLSITALPQIDLGSVYEALIWRVEALAAARLAGATFRLPSDADEASARRAALADHDAVTMELAKASAAARAEKQLARQIALAQAADAVKSRLKAVGLLLQ